MRADKPKSDLSTGTLDMLVLKILMRGHLHVIHGGVCKPVLNGSAFDVGCAIGGTGAKDSVCCRKRWNSTSIQLAQDLVAEGLPESKARAFARRKFGNMTQKSEEARSTWITRWMSDLAQDLRHTFRGMRRDAGFTMFVILIAGLGIGASSTVFSVVNGLLLRPLPFRNPGRLAWISNMADWTSTQTEHYVDLRERNRSFSDLAGWNAYYQAGNEEMTGEGEPERLTGVAVTGNFFSVLGMEPILGRSFTTEECQGRYSAPPALLLSHSFWRRRFASDPGIVGQKLILNNQPVTVAGVLPSTFDFAGLFAPGTPVDLFIPWPVMDKTKPQGNTLKLIGRLKPGVTIAGAQAEFTALGKRREGASRTERGCSEADGA